MAVAPTGIARLVAFARTPEARPARVGCLGAVLMLVGGLGAGSIRLNDPLLESLHLSWLRFGHGLVVSSVLLPVVTEPLTNPTSSRMTVGVAVFVGAVVSS